MSQSLMPCLPPQSRRTFTPRSRALMMRSRITASTNLGCWIQRERLAESMMRAIWPRLWELLQTRPTLRSGSKNTRFQSASKPAITWATTAALAETMP